MDGPHHEREDLLLPLLRRPADPDGVVLSIEVELQTLLGEDALQVVPGPVIGRLVELLLPGWLVACLRLPLLSRQGAADKIEVGRDQSVELGGLHPHHPLPTQRVVCLAEDMLTVAMMAGISTSTMSASHLSLLSAQADPVEAEILVGIVLEP